MSTKHHLYRLSGIAVAAALIVSGGTVANAGAPAIDADSIADAVSSVTPVASSTVVPSVTSDGIKVDTAEGGVSLPLTSAGALTIAADSGAGEVAVSLPALGTTAAATVADDGTVVYADGGSVDVAVQADATSARIHTVLNDDSAPDEYAYSFPGATPVLQPDGSVLLTYEAEGVSVDRAVVAAPWAFDKDGTSVETRYRVEGNAVIQELELDEGLSYPIVADPWIQGDCGIVTCTVRFDRATTRNIRDGANLGAIAGGVVTIFSGGIVLPVAGVITAFLAANSVFAGRYYENGNCFGIKVVPGVVVNPWWPSEVTRNTHNCR